MMERLSRALGVDSNAAGPNYQLDERLAVEDRSIDEARPMRVVVIGSGISGILASIRLRERVSNLELCVYEKNEDIGGTWLENRYPGCACGA